MANTPPDDGTPALRPCGPMSARNPQTKMNSAGLVSFFACAAPFVAVLVGTLGCGRSAIDDLTYPASDSLGSTTDTCGAAGGVTVLASGLDTESVAPVMRDVQADANAVYWAGDLANGSAGILSVPRCGGAVSTVATAGGSTIGGLVIDSTSVYWTDPDVGAVMSAPLAGGVATTLASGQVQPSGIAVDATSVYWTASGEQNSFQVFGNVMRVALAGGAPETLLTQEGNPVLIAVDADNVYWGDQSTSSLVELPLAGGFPSTLVSLQEGYFTHLTVANGSLYWSTNDTVASLLVAGGTPVTLAASAGAFFDGVAVSATNAYWTDGAAGTVSSEPLGGSVVATLATGQSPQGVAVSYGAVYWTNATSVASVNVK